MREWILSGVTTGLFLIAWFSVRTWVSRTNLKIDKLIEKIEVLAGIMISHKEQLASMTRRIGLNEKRLNEHSTRIRKIEETDAVQNAKINNIKT